MIQKMQKIGIYGGSFDPIHIGHLIIAQSFVEQFDIDKCIFIPAFLSPHKSGENTFLHPTERLDIVKIAIKRNPKFAVNDFEIKSGKSVYTIETVKKLKTEYPESSFFLLIGSDQLLSFKKWYKYEELAKEVQIVVARRMIDESNKILENKELDDIRALELISPIIEISSTEIRDRVYEGKRIEYLVSRKIEKRIKKIKKNRNN